MTNINPHLQIRIKTYDPAKLAGQLLPDVNPNNIIKQLSEETVFLPNYPGAFKNGQILDLYGEDAIRLYKIINQMNSEYSNVVEILYYGRPIED